MSVTKIPSIYDYLGQGITQFAENRHQRSREQLADKYQKLALLNGLYQSGGIGADSFQQSLSASGIPGISGIQIQPSASEKKERYIAGLDPNEQQDARAQSMGFTPPADIALERAGKQASTAKSQFDLETAREDRPTVKAAATLKLGDAQASSYDEAGKRYIGSVIGTTGGRIDPSKSKTIVDQAFQKYMQDRQTSGVGVLADPQIVRAHFENALQDAIIEQRKMDTQRLSATQGRMTDQDRTLQQLVMLENNTASQAEKYLTQISGSNGITLKATNPTLYKEYYDKYMAEMDKRDHIRHALTTMLPGDVQKVIGSQLPGGTATVNPDPAAGGAVVGMSPAEFSKAVELINQVPSGDRKAFLDRRKAAGRLNDADYNKLLSRFGLTP